MSHLGKTGCWFLILLFLSACSAKGPVNIKGEAITDVYPTFIKGELRLKCGASCAGAWGSARSEAKRYYENGLWKDLVYMVAQVGHEGDLTYFYLGTAARKLGQPDAAQVYFHLARATRYKCASFLNNCDGFDIPALLDQVQNSIPQATPPDDPTIPYKTFSVEQLRASYAQNPQPAYPAESRIKREQGRIVLKATIDPNGNCQSVVVHESSGYPRLDDAAVSAVSRWHFIPFVKNGDPITAKALIPVIFSLRNE